MAAGDWAAQIKLGRPGYELSIGGTTTANLPPPFEITPMRKEVENENVVGQSRTRVFRGRDVQYVVKLFNASSAIRDAIMGIYAIKDTHLSFIFADDWKVYSERYVMDSLTSFPLEGNPHVLLDQAYNSLSPTGSAIITGWTVSTAYGALGVPATTTATFTTYDRAAGRVTVSPTQTTSQVLYIDYAYDGALVKFASAPRIVQSGAFQGSLRGYDLTMLLEGV